MELTTFSAYDAFNFHFIEGVFPLNGSASLGHESCGRVETRAVGWFVVVAINRLALVLIFPDVMVHSEHRWPVMTVLSLPSSTKKV